MLSLRKSWRWRIKRRREHGSCEEYGGGRLLGCCFCSVAFRRSRAALTFQRVAIEITNWTKLRAPETTVAPRHRSATPEHFSSTVIVSAQVDVSWGLALRRPVMNTSGLVLPFVLISTIASAQQGPKATTSPSTASSCNIVCQNGANNALTTDGDKAQFTACWLKNLCKNAKPPNPIARQPPPTGNPFPSLGVDGRV